MVSNNLEFRVKGEVPAKKNSRITLRNGKTIPSEKYRAWHKYASLIVSAQALKQWGRLYTITDPVRIEVTFVHGDFVRRDSDNGLSSVLDLLTDCEILQDDNWRIVRKIEVKNEYKKNEAECLIKIYTENDYMDEE